MGAPLAISPGAESAHGALDSKKLPADLVPGPVHFTVRGAANDSLKVKVVLKSEQLWLHHTGRAPHQGCCSRHQHLHETK